MLCFARFLSNPPTCSGRSCTQTLSRCVSASTMSLRCPLRHISRSLHSTCIPVQRAYAPRRRPPDAEGGQLQVAHGHEHSPPATHENRAQLSQRLPCGGAACLARTCAPRSSWLQHRCSDRACCSPSDVPACMGSRGALPLAGCKRSSCFKVATSSIEGDVHEAHNGRALPRGKY